MTKFSHRLLAICDYLYPFNWFVPKTKCHIDTEPSAEFDRVLWRGWGPKFCIVRPDGIAPHLGDGWEIYHLYDSNGNFIARGTRWQLCAKPEDTVIFGHDRVYEKYNNQKRPGPESGMIIHE